MPKKHKLDSNLLQDYSIVGIVTQLKDYKLCLFLNKNLGLNLVRTNDIHVNANENETMNSFPFYRFYDKHSKTNWYLLGNKNHLHQSMLYRYKQINFFLIYDGTPPFTDINTYISLIKKIANVQLVQEIKMGKNKGFEYLLQDLEMHLLELDRRKKE